MSTAAPAPIQAEKILKELENLWISLGQQEGEDESTGVLRACSMTLLVAIEEPPFGGEDAAAPDTRADVGETVAELMHDYPSRAIVLRVPMGDAPLLDARVFAQCWMPFGRRQQICCEQIEISATRPSLPHVPAVIRGLTAPDLPLVLWCRDADLLEAPAFDQILPLASLLIVDSRAVRSPRQWLAKLRTLESGGLRVADLAWTRITRWRESVAQLFDHVDLRGLARKIESVTIRYSTPDVPVAAMYLGAWVRACLGREVGVTLEQAGQAMPWVIQEMVLEGAGVRASIVRRDRNAVEMETSGHSTRLQFQRLTDAELVREELSIRGRDEIYERVLDLL
ncbi:MAG: hypothetical protein FJW40_11675 [Acidobacteria bacterium]|nr:hypothetical protein [Acidobacteriota bacterium]